MRVGLRMHSVIAALACVHAYVRNTVAAVVYLAVVLIGNRQSRGRTR